MARAFREGPRPFRGHRRVSVSVRVDSAVTVPRRRTPCQPHRRHQLRRNQGRTRSKAEAIRIVGASQPGQRPSAGRIRPKKIVARMIRSTNRPPKTRAKSSTSDIDPSLPAATQLGPLSRDDLRETIPHALPHNTPVATDCLLQTPHVRHGRGTPGISTNSWH